LPNHFRVTNVSGNNNNCLIFSIAAGIGRNLTPEEALQIRREIGVHHNGFLENTTDTVNNICSALGQSIEIRWWLQTSANTVTPAGINVTYGTGPNGGQVVNVVEVGNNHFQLLSEI
jgi:Tfp pilus assembly protein PilZ